jgi:hypothetical protein
MGSVSSRAWKKVSVSTRQERMLAAFRSHESRRASILVDHSVVGVPLGARLRQINRLPSSWRLWTDTADFVYGSYLELHNDGSITHTTLREDEGPETFVRRPTDDYIASMGGRQR